MKKLTLLAFAAVFVAFSASSSGQQNDLVMAPKFEVDPNFPKELPKGWVTGMSVGVAVDEQDHVWMVHRPPTISPNERAADQDPPTAECCKSAPPVMEFDQTGTLLRRWGGDLAGAPFQWPLSNHGLWVDQKGFIWIGANHNTDSHILKFTKDGKFVAQYGKPGQATDSNDPDDFGSPAKIQVDPKRNEAYVADGYRNKRVVVINSDTGERLRYWGAYGNKPDDASLGRYVPGEKPTQQFRGPVHCAMISTDDLVYVCDRQSNRVQVFTREGKFVNEMIIAPKTGGDGSIWDITFSKDPQQKWMYIADGKNMRVYIVDRKKLELVSSFGDGGRQPGQFFGAHSIAIDSKGNLYTVETYEGRRLQKFVFKGEQMVPRWQGVPWPAKK